MALELKDLTDEERLALVGLLEMVAGADRNVTEPELDRMQSIVAAVGVDAYQAAAEAADDRFEDVEELKRFLTTITRQEACEIIYGAALEVVLADAPGGPESDILDWLAGVWKVETKIIDPPQ